MNQKKWSFWIDRGGTFTDIVAKSPKDKIVVKKFLSQSQLVVSSLQKKLVRHLKSLLLLWR